MRLFSVGLTGDEAKSSICSDALHIEPKDRGFLVECHRCARGSYIFLEYDADDAKRSAERFGSVKEQLRAALAEFLTRFIFEYESRRILRRWIEKNFYYFAQSEQDSILLHAEALLGDYERSMHMREEIKRKLMEHLYAHATIILEGFIRFRLRFYEVLLREIAEQAIEIHLNEVEYQEFIDVLKQFVKMNEAQLPLMHVVLERYGPHTLYDAAFEKLDYTYVDMIERTTPAEHEELLISTLINLAPERIVLHLGSRDCDETIVRTLESIFIDRLSICEDCAFCENSKCLDSHLQ